MPKKRNGKKLTDREEAFCNEYLVDLNITKAAIRAKYSEKTAYSIGSEVLKRPEIQARIAELRDKCMKETRETPARLLKDFREIAELTKEKKDYTASISALEKIGKHLGFFEKDNNQNIEIKFEITNYGDQEN